MKIDKLFELMNAVELYFLYLSDEYFIKALENFSRGIGYCIDDYVSCGFSNEYEVDDDGYFGDAGVKFEIDPPAYDYNKKQIIENEEFVSFITKIADQYKNEHPTECIYVDNLIEEISNKLVR